MATVKKFEDLEIWQKAIDLAVNVYTIKQKGDIDFGTIDHLRRSALSISSNIAEGFEYNNNRQFSRFLKYAKASCGELRSQVIVIYKVGFIANNTYTNLRNQCIELSKQISNLQKYVSKSK